MLYEHRRPDVAVFIDFENVYVSVRDKLDENPNFETIMDRCHDLGRVIIARAYADWYRYPRITSALYANSIEPMYVPTYYYDKDVGRTGRAIKNSVDMNICIDAMKTLFMHQNVEKFVLVTGDRDFIPLVHSIRQQGKEVIIIGIGGAASTHLAQSADEFLFYEQLHGKPAPAALPKQRLEPELPAAAAAVALSPTIEPTPPAPKAPDIYDTLVAAVRLVRERGYVSTLGSIKLVMKELMGGDFKENRYKDMNGRAFTKFKDFVQDAERRGHVQIFTSGTVNEVFLPGEDPLKLSQFVGDLREEVPLGEAPDVELPVSNNGQAKGTSPAPEAATAGSSANRSRRRRRRKPASERTGVSAPTATMSVEALDDTDDASEADSPTALGLEELALLAGEVDAVVPFAEPELPDLSEDDLLAIAPDADRTDPPNPFETSQQLTADATALLEAVWADLASDTSSAAPAISPTLAALIDELEVPSISHAVATDTFLAAPPETGAAEDIAPTPVEAEVRFAETGAAEGIAPTPVEAEVRFSDAEWQAFRNMIRAFGRPVSFTQIIDGLRELRNQQIINYTNEQMRTFAKQAINGGILEKTGRGRHTYYQLKVEEETAGVVGADAEAVAPVNGEANADADVPADALTNAEMPANADAAASAVAEGAVAVSAEADLPVSGEHDGSAPAVDTAETPEEYPATV